MRLIELRGISFRNLESDRVSFGPATNLVVGGNGQGKTNLLEAVAVLGNLRSFRASSMRQIVRHGSSEFMLEGRFESARGIIRLAQTVSVGPPVRRRLSVSGGLVSTPAYLRVFPIVALSGSDRELVLGGPGERRRFLDRFTFLLDDDYFDEIRRYRRLLRQRNAALVAGVADDELSLWESRLASAAAVVVVRRRASCRVLAAAFQPIYLRLGGERFPSVDIEYRGEAGLQTAENTREVEEYYQKRYNETRMRDRRNGFTADGPHRHDLGLRTEGRLLRHTLSSGQTKVVAAALRLASLHRIEQEKGELLPVIVDDIDAELDEEVLSRLTGFLSGNRQIFASSADDRVCRMLSDDARRIEVRQGNVSSAAGERLHE